MNNKIKWVTYLAYLIGMMCSISVYANSSAENDIKVKNPPDPVITVEASKRDLSVKDSVESQKIEKGKVGGARPVIKEQNKDKKDELKGKSN